MASWKIFVITFVLLNFGLQVGTHWGNFYPSSGQRGERSQSEINRPIMVLPFDFNSGGIKGDIDRESESYAIANVDDYAFKKTLFSNRNMW